MNSIQRRYAQLFDAAQNEASRLLALDNVILNAVDGIAPYHALDIDFERNNVGIHSSYVGHLEPFEIEVLRIRLPERAATHSVAKALNSPEFEALVDAYDGLLFGDYSSEVVAPYVRKFADS